MGGIDVRQVVAVQCTVFASSLTPRVLIADDGMRTRCRHWESGDQFDDQHTPLWSRIRISDGALRRRRNCWQDSEGRHLLHRYTNIDWCRGQHWKIMPQSCVMLPEGRRPEGNIAQLRGIIFQCWSRLTVNSCFVISRKRRKNYRIQPYRHIQTGNSQLRETCSNFFANDYIIFTFLNSLKYVKYEREWLFKPF